jgi:FdhE protein
MNTASEPILGAAERLEALATKHSEWSPWLSVVREVIAELTGPAWDTQPPRTVAGTDVSPQLAGAVLQPNSPAVANLLDRLIGVARSNGLDALTGPARGAPKTPVDEALAVFVATVNGDDAQLDQQALRAGAKPEGWRALVQLLPMPYLHACARRWMASPRTAWSQGYCPVCGAWPAFAEIRGIQRARHLRSGRCRG